MTDPEEAERRLGRAMVIGLPLVGGAATVAVGLLAGFGSAILVLASTALLSTIGLLWASLRTLSGDAPLPGALAAATPRRGASDELAERKRRVLRALKDLENERAIGKIDEADYAEVAARYREEAKAVMRAIEAELGPAIEQAERMARDYLSRREKTSRTAGAAGAKSSVHARNERRVVCAECQASNEPDAVFCKGCGARVAGAGSEPSHAKA